MPHYTQSHWRMLPVVLLILLNLLIGSLVVRNYGESWDEAGNIAYGQYSLQNFSNLFEGKPIVNYDKKHLDEKGPVFFILVVLVARLETALIPGWTVVNAWHFVYFLTFQAGLLALYFLVRRWASDWASFGVTLLFSTQPLLWGHAFINPKDIPFMVFFLASITAGLYMVDAILPAPVAQENFILDVKSTFAAILTDWRVLTQPEKRSFGIFSSIAAFITLLFVSGRGLLNTLLGQLVTAAYSAAPESFLNRIFRAVAQSSSRMPVDYYIEKVQAIFNVFWVLFLILILLAVFGRFIALLRSLQSLTITSLHAFGSFLLHPRLLAAGVILGLTVSIRFLGPLAGVVVALYALERSFKRAIPLVAAYALSAIVSALITWPYLWASPVSRFLQVLNLMSKYVWTEQVLFNGIFYAPDKLPWYYLPELLSLQLTEPLILLFLVGVLVIGFQAKRYRTLEFAGLGIWFLAPLVGPMLVGSTIYDNFRQFFFVLPPIFVLAGIGLDAVLKKMSAPWLKAALLFVLIFPGLYSGFRLHPYEYVYYNSLAGGTAGAFRRFEMDYWGTSYKAAAEFLNKEAPPNAAILVFGPVNLLQRYTRPDLKVIAANDALVLKGKYDYSVSLTRWNNDLKSCAQAPAIAAISRDRVVFTVIRQLNGNESACP